MNNTSYAAIISSMILLTAGVSPIFAASIEIPDPKEIPPFVKIGNLKNLEDDDKCLIPTTNGDRVAANITKNKPGVLECKGVVLEDNNKQDKGHPEDNRVELFCVRTLENGSEEVAKSWVMHAKDGNARLHCHF